MRTRAEEVGPVRTREMVNFSDVDVLCGRPLIANLGNGKPVKSKLSANVD